MWIVFLLPIVTQVKSEYSHALRQFYSECSWNPGIIYFYSLFNKHFLTIIAHFKKSASSILRKQPCISENSEWQNVDLSLIEYSGTKSEIDPKKLIYLFF